MSRIKQQELRIKVFKNIISALFFILYSLFLASPTYAATCTAPGGGIDIGACFGFGNITSLGDATSKLVVPAFSIAAAAVVIYFLLGAFKYLRSGGNKEEIEGARKMISQAIIGFIILMFAFLVLQFIPQFFNLGGLDIFK